jgi:hypothetical protein
MIVMQRWYYRRGVWLRLRLVRRLNHFRLETLRRTADVVADLYWRLRELIKLGERSWELGPRQQDQSESWPYPTPITAERTPVEVCGSCGRSKPADSNGRAA